MHNNVAILIPSCDKFSDVWPIFFELFDKYWPQCPFKIYLGTNYLEYKNKKNISTIKIGKDISWADNTRKMLSFLEEEYVIILLDDFFLNKKIDNHKLNKIIDLAIQHKFAYIRLEPNPPGTNFKRVEKFIRIGEISRNAPYSITTQPGLWQIKILEKFLLPGYSIWDFEMKGSERYKRTNLKFYTIDKKIISHYNGIERGKFYASTLTKLKKEGIALHTKREIYNDKNLIHFIKIKWYRIKLYLMVQFNKY